MRFNISPAERRRTNDVVVPVRPHSDEFAWHTHGEISRRSNRAFSIEKNLLIYTVESFTLDCASSPTCTCTCARYAVFSRADVNATCQGFVPRDHRSVNSTGCAHILTVAPSRFSPRAARHAEISRVDIIVRRANPGRYRSVIYVAPVGRGGGLC